MKTHLISKTVVVTFVMALGSLLANAQNVKVDSQETQLLLAASSAVTLQSNFRSGIGMASREPIGVSERRLPDPR